MTLPLMLFAAGLGTRMGALTKTMPKPMIPVAGKPLVGHALDLADAAGVTKRVANTHYLPDLIEPYLATRDTQALREEPLILDTGGGLKHALPHLGQGPVMTLNTDAVWTGPNPLIALKHAWRDDMGALMLLVPLDRACGRKGSGDFSRSSDGTLRRGGDLVFTGAQILDPTPLRDIPEDAFSLWRLWEPLLQSGRLFGIIHDGGWADVGHPEGIALAEDMLRNV